jgi:AcrR family transcriptional regulator
MMPTKVEASKPSARERLLAAADELFYSDGVQTVGIDRIVQRAGVAKASLYNLFGSKDQLVQAYLDARTDATREQVERTLTRFRTPRERLLGVFDAQGQVFTQPDFNGCAHLTASAEAEAGSPIECANDRFRQWVRTLFTDLARESGVADFEGLARQLHLLYDGAGVSARMDRDPSAATTAREAAAVLFDAAAKDQKPVDAEE